jgi:hypothetical protein
MTFSIIIKNATLSIIAEGWYAKCPLCLVSLMLSITFKPFMLSVIMVNFIMLSVIMLSAMRHIHINGCYELGNT